MTIIQSLPPVEVRDEATISVREFFPNLTVSTKYEMDDMAVTPPDSQQEIVTNEIKVNLHLPESNSPVISESETVFEVVNPVTEKEMESTSVLDLQSTPSVLEPISS